MINKISILLLFLVTLCYADITKQPKYDITSLENNPNDTFRVRENFKDLSANKADGGNGNAYLSSEGAIYFGDINTNGTWRIIRNGNNLVFERLESGSWVSKNTITP